MQDTLRNLASMIETASAELDTISAAGLQSFDLETANRAYDVAAGCRELLETVRGALAADDPEARRPVGETIPFTTFGVTIHDSTAAQFTVEFADYASAKACFDSIARTTNCSHAELWGWNDRDGMFHVGDTKLAQWPQPATAREQPASGP